MDFLYSLPANLIWEELFEDYPLLKHLTSRADQYMIYICGLITHLEHTRDEDILDKNRGYIPLSSKLLREVCSNYNEYLQYLVDAEVLDCDNYFEIKEKCRGYKFLPPYRNQGLIEHEITHYLVKNNIRSFTEKQDKKKRATVQKYYPYMLKWFESGKLSIDISLYNKFIQNYPLSSLTKKQRKKLAGTLDACEYMRRNILRGKYNENVDSTSYRLHSVITNMKSQMRECLLYDGEPLISVDIKCSQPYFLLRTRTAKILEVL